jgi:hypothetical protein
MAFQTGDRIRETTTTTGTGVITLAGATTGNRAFSAVCANGDVIYYCIADQSGANWEVGLGTWGTGNLLTRVAGSVLSSSAGAGVLTTFGVGTKDVFCTVPAAKINQLNNQGIIVLPISITSNPVAPPADTLNLFAWKYSGKMFLEYENPSGVSNAVQQAVWVNNMGWYMPNTGTTLGLNTGAAWTTGGTISHPNPTAGRYLQTGRTRWANVVTTTNQQLGIIQAAASLNKYWRGNAAGLGGWFMYARFGIGLWPAATVRLFVGLTSLTTNMTGSDAPTGDFVGLWHDTTDAATVLSIITRNNTTTTKTTIAGVPTLAANQAFDFYLFAKPNDTTIFYRLDDAVTGTTIADTSVVTTLPTNTAFMGPQLTMSNGTANVTVTTTAFELTKFYIESDN